MNKQRLRVLAFEDEPSDGALLCRHAEMIDKWQVEIVVCETATAGLSELSRHGADVILLDYQLGGETGLTVLSAIRETHKECPVIFLTGRGDEQLAVRILQAGASDYLPKRALSVNSLTRCLANALEKSRLERLIREQRENLQQAYTNLERRNREIEGFYHTVSHELRTPITSAREFVRIMLEGLSGPIEPKQRECLEIVEQSCEQMLRSINDLLDASRLETGKLRLETESRPIGKLLEQVVEAMSPLAREAEIRLRAQIADSLPDVCVDPLRFSQIVRNLLGNAIKFSPPGEQVVAAAELSPDGESVSISVSDRGAGISEEHRERIFDRHYQISHEEDVAKGGLGLGLSICFQLVELHGGRIDVDSEIGEGTAFRFTLPLAAELQLEPITD